MNTNPTNKNYNRFLNSFNDRHRFFKKEEDLKKIGLSYPLIDEYSTHFFNLTKSLLDDGYIEAVDGYDAYDLTSKGKRAKQIGKMTTDILHWFQPNFFNITALIISITSIVLQRQTASLKDDLNVTNRRLDSLSQILQSHSVAIQKATELLPTAKQQSDILHPEKNQK